MFKKMNFDDKQNGTKLNDTKKKKTKIADIEHNRDPNNQLFENCATSYYNRLYVQVLGDSRLCRKALCSSRPSETHAYQLITDTLTI